MAQSLATTRLPPLLRLLLVVAMVVLCAGVARVSGLYEDQVGAYDWVQPRIGGVRFAAFLTSSQRKRVLVGTDRNVIAALNLRTGDIAWRRVLGDKDTLHALDMGGRYLVTLSGTEAAAVRAWAVPDGTLAWETMLPLPSAAEGGGVTAKFITIPATDSSSPDRVVVLLGSASASAAEAAEPAAARIASEVHCLSAATGEVLWSATLSTHAHTISLLPHGPILLTSLSPSLSFSLTNLDAASGKTTATAASPPSSSSSFPRPAAYVTATGTSVAVDSASGSILTVLLVTADANATAATVQVHSTPLASLLPKEHYQSGVSAAVVPEKAPGNFFWLSVPGAVFLLSAGAADGQAGSAGQVSLVNSFPGFSAVSASVAGGATGAGAGAGAGGGEGAEGGSFYSGLVGSQSSGDTLKFHTQVNQLLPSSSSPSSSPPAVLSDSVSVPSHRGPPVRVFLNAYSRAAGAGGRGRVKDEKAAGEGTAGAFGFRLLVVGEDDSLSLLQQGEVVWEREEALASVVAVSIAELPEEEEELSVAAVEHDIYEWARTHVLRAKVSLNLGSAEEQALVHRLRTASPEKIKPFRDRNGFRRILLLLTAPGGGNRGAGGGSGASGGNSGRGMGKLFALHSGDGRVLWAAALPSGGSSGGRGASVFSPEALVLWRDPHRMSPDQTPEALVLQTKQQKQEQQEVGDREVAHAALVTVVNGHTGDVLESKGLPFVPRLVAPLPLVGKDERRLVMLVEKAERKEEEGNEGQVKKEETGGKEQGQKGQEKGGAAAAGGGKARLYEPVGVHVFPGTEEARSLFEGHKKEVFFYQVDTVTGAVEGYSIGEEVKDEAGSGGSGGRSDGGRLGGGLVYGAVLVWQVVLPAGSEVIAAIAAPKREESQHTQVRALGDRSVQFKLLSKNLLFLATTTPPATAAASASASAGAAGAGGEEAGAVVVYVIDTVGGMVVERVVHEGMQGPVHAVMAENWVVYHYFNPAASRYEVSTIELLDTSLKDVPVIDYLKYGLSIPGASNLTAPISAAEIPWGRVMRLRQSYYFPYALRCISVTSTLAGITNKHVLFGTALDQVLALDRRFLDPRRVPEPSQQDKEAGIMPYSDSLPAPGQAYLTHRYRIEGLRHILSFPTRLESTTLVLAHGLDLFFVRTAPSRVFDSLGEDFSFALLLGTIAVLSVAILVTWGLSRKQELKQRWKLGQLRCSRSGIFAASVLHAMALVPILSRFKAIVLPARSEPPFPLESLPDDVLALVLRSLAQTSFRHALVSPSPLERLPDDMFAQTSFRHAALVSKRWLRLATSALSHLTVQHRGFSNDSKIETHPFERDRCAELAWLPLPRLLSALRRFPALTHVSLGEISILSADGDALFHCLAATCPRLLHLTVEHQFGMSVTVDGLASLFQGCRKLRELFLLTTNGLPHLPPSLSLLTDLQTLHVCSRTRYGHDSLQELVSPPESIGALQQLRELRIGVGLCFRGLGLDQSVGLLRGTLRKLSITSAIISPARSEPPFPLESLPDDILAIVLRALAQTSFRHAALVSKRWLRLSTAALSHLNVQRRSSNYSSAGELYLDSNALHKWLRFPRLVYALRRFPALTHVTLGEFSISFVAVDDDDALFHCLAATCPRLLHLTLENQLGMRVTVDGLASLFHGCRKLRELRLLTTTCLPHLPASLSLLTDLQTLHVCAARHFGHDSLQELVSPPESIRELQQLRELRICAGANFRGLDEWVGSLGNLRKLSISNLSSDTVTKLPGAIGDLALLETLEMKLDGLESIPDSFEHLTGLKTLSLQCRRLRCLPEKFMAVLTQLQHLSLRDCPSLESLPESISLLPLSSPNLSSSSPVTPLSHHIVDNASDGAARAGEPAPVILGKQPAGMLGKAESDAVREAKGASSLTVLADTFTITQFRVMLVNLGRVKASDFQ
ncbi:unnamed protein product [Closterium sp. Yama58-4]|nr:unnamed protein product [Closterium sp. Yama58-4]